MLFSVILSKAFYVALFYSFQVLKLFHSITEIVLFCCFLPLFNRDLNGMLHSSISFSWLSFSLNKSQLNIKNLIR